MKLFNFVKKNNNKEIIIHAPLNGELISLEEVPDPAFSEKLIGDGLAIKPSDTDIIEVSNISNKGILSVFKTGHAFTLEIGTLELLVHLGIETVSLKGSGFEVLVEVEKHYPVNTEIVKIYRSEVEGKVPSLISPIVSSSMECVDSIQYIKSFGTIVTKGEAIMRIILS